VDTDGDGINDGIEYQGYGTNPRAIDSDGDGCRDSTEILSVDNNPFLNTVVNSADLALVAMAFGPGNYVADYDVNSDGVLGANDLGLIASKFNQRC
jgi:hypothetical protein